MTRETGPVASHAGQPGAPSQEDLFGTEPTPRGWRITAAERALLAEQVPGQLDVFDALKDDALTTD